MINQSNNNPKKLTLERPAILLRSTLLQKSLNAINRIVRKYSVESAWVGLKKTDREFVSCAPSTNITQKALILASGTTEIRKMAR